MLGLASVPTEGEMLSRTLVQLINNIKNFRFTSGAYIYYILERNVGCENEHAAIVNHMDRVLMLSDHSGTQEGDNPKPGINTDAQKKTEYKLLLSIELRNDSIVFIDELMVIPSPGASVQTTRDAMRAMLIEQMKRARLTKSASYRAHNNATVSWSAKLDSEGKPKESMRDDLLLSFVFILYVLKRLKNGSWPERAAQNRFLSRSG